jgi:hypothetical protein
MTLSIQSPALRVLSIYDIYYKILVDRKTAKKNGANAGGPHILLTTYFQGY